MVMTKRIRPALLLLCAVTALPASTALAQIDPDPRQILHAGVNAPLKGSGPLGAYLFYYWNMPNVPSTNEVLRLAIAPTYLDSELGFQGLLGEHTDLAVGAFGGAFANSYQEVRAGYTHRDESFDGYSGGASASIYHLFNPAGRIPLSGILRETVTYNAWDKTSDTSDRFELPEDQPIFTTRVGLRWGGKEPVLWPTLALELSAWYELDQRTDPRAYGFNDDRPLNRIPQRVFGRALVHLTTLQTQHYIVGGLMGGAAFDSDRLSCFRLGGVLPYTKEFPLTIPGYYYQELSAKDFGLLFATYAIPFGYKQEWRVFATGGAAVVKYQDGMGQPGAFNSGLGGGLAYSAPSRRWKALGMFGYGFEAERSDGRGGMSLAFAIQYNFGPTKLASDEAYDEWRNSSGGRRSPAPR
jgi:hypothetical protein